MGMEDPAREGVKTAMEHAKRAGIRTIMITGDNLDTASAIARQVGIVGDALEDRDLDGKSTEELQRILKTTSVFARVTPLHKITILEALKAQGEVVSMTGDGVNDAPALKGAACGRGDGESRHTSRQGSRQHRADR